MTACEGEGEGHDARAGGRVGREQVLAAVRRMCDAVEQNQQYLCDLDAALGDGDHGITMAKSFRAVRDRLPSMADKDIASLMREVGMVLISTVGGAMGPLFGTAFMRAGAAVAGKQDLGASDIAAMLAAARDGIIARGKASVGDKTMLDTIHPAAEACARAAEAGRPLGAVLEEMVAAGRRGMESTTPLTAKVGRASRLGERTRGHQDPGATSAYILIEAASTFRRVSSP